MKTILLSTVLGLLVLSSVAQDDKALMEKRSRDFFTAINSDDQKVWIKFIEENFSPSLIKKPMKKQVQVSEQGDVSKSNGSASEAEGTVEQKAMMFRQLHNDFAKGKIISVKTDVQKATMVVQSVDGLNGKFNLGFEKGSMLIEALGIEIVQEQ